MKLTARQELEILFIGERISTLIDEEAEEWANEKLGMENQEEMTNDQILERHHKLCVAFRNYLLKSVL